MLWSAWQPGDSLAWVLENMIPALLAFGLFLGRRWVRLSSLSSLLLFAFLVLHQAGAHYVYSEVPWGWWLGASLGSPRNDFDRLVHLCFGLLVFWPLREVMGAWLRIAPVRAGFVALLCILAASALYEIIEMLVVMIVYPDTGADFLGLQGDPWDSQKDMAMAGLGAMLSYGLALLRAGRLRQTRWG